MSRRAEVQGARASSGGRRALTLGVALLAAAALLWGLWQAQRVRPAAEPEPPAADAPEHAPGTPSAAGDGAAPAHLAPPADLAVRADFVGSAACRDCHAQETRAWTGSDHDLAMQPADESSVLGDFDDARFEHFGVVTTFSRRDGRYMVRTDGPDGALTDYAVAFVFGIYPLQQYLVPFPGGRLQALGVAWDSRPEAEGGQRWFHLYPDERVDHNDALHWSGRYQNWNLMCAECHSTDLRKGYDAATDSYATTYSEIDVACEACHGPGRRHVEWAAGGGAGAPTAAAGEAGRPDAEGPAAGTTPDTYATGDGLAVHLRSDWAGAWLLPEPGARFSVRQAPLDPALTNVCAACHARRSTLVEGGLPGAPLQDSHRPVPLAPPNYRLDGQQHDEVYTWGSFVQSRMHAAGVTCVDCHDPHSLELRQPGNALCQRCHESARFDTPSHHHHEPESAGARCVSCHMPARTYMVVDDRRDHSLRVPRPDLGAALGSPDACTSCHSDQQPAWAAASMDGWYGSAWRQRPQWGPTLQAAAQGAPGALPSLLALASDPERPGLVRATAVSFALPLLEPSAQPAIEGLLRDADPAVRSEALQLLEPFDAPTRVRLAGPLLSDPVRGVRIEAARVLADVPDGQLALERRPARQRALDECLAALELNADWPAETVNRGNLALRQGRTEEALAAFRRAIALDARFVGAYVNLADTLRQLGREDEGEQALRDGLAAVPRAADLHHALGLLLVRRQDMSGALAELGRAAVLSPENPRYAYVYAVGLHSVGRIGEALQTLTAAAQQHPYDIELLSTLVSVHRERGEPGDADAALHHAQRLLELRPGDVDLARFVQQLELER